MRVNGIIPDLLVIRIDQRVTLAIGTRSSSNILMRLVASKWGLT